MPNDADQRDKPKDAMEAFELAALRNAPLSVVRPSEIGREPMARGRFLKPVDGAVVIENLQVPGRDVHFYRDTPLDAFFQYDGEVYQFRTRVLEMETPVQLNDVMIVRGMKIAAPKSIEKGNRRAIFRQTFASLKPPIDVGIWAVPLEMLTEAQREHHARYVAAEGDKDDARNTPEPEAEGGDEGDAPGTSQAVVQKAAPTLRGIAPAATLMHPSPDICLHQFRAIFQTDPHWAGEIADASEFGLGLTVQRVVYSRFKVFQPLAVRFKLPDMETHLEFLIEIRRVQGLRGTDARLGGLLLVNATDSREVQAARELARFSLQLQRERAKRMRDAG